MDQSLIGCKVFVQRGDEDLRAELLLERIRKGKLEFYVHYDGFNKRLDEWVEEARLKLDKGIERPAKKSEGGEEDQTDKVKNAGEGGQTSGDASGEGAPEDVKFDSQKEIEKLRSSGSMTQNPSEVHRVRNLNKVIFGEYEIEPWYFSPYPVEFVEEDQIYICEYSLQYFVSKTQFHRFRSKYKMRHPPGNEIYRDAKFSFFEVDGRQQRTWCRNLSLFSKLFLDHKTVYYDVDPFLFYCMTTRDEYGHHLVGYFSKEKDSADGYNVACILSLPPYQRFGYGKVLIDFSYNLSKKEHKVGSPEKPLSDLGLISYRSYWRDILIEYMVDKVGLNGSTTIEELSASTAFTTQDILGTLQAMNMLKYNAGQYIICLTGAAAERYEERKKKNPHRIDPACLRWKPPMFSAAQLRFSY